MGKTSTNAIQKYHVGSASCSRECAHPIDHRVSSNACAPPIGIDLVTTTGRDASLRCRVVGSSRWASLTSTWNVVVSSRANARRSRNITIDSTRDDHLAVHGNGVISSARRTGLAASRYVVVSRWTDAVNSIVNLIDSTTRYTGLASRVVNSSHWTRLTQSWNVVKSCVADTRIC